LVSDKKLAECGLENEQETTEKGEGGYGNNLQKREGFALNLF
jgi:hypothetical protein